MNRHIDQAGSIPTRTYADRHFRVRDGLSLHYRDYPGSHEVPPILCLHGLTRNARDFERLADRYAGRFRVLALDFRGRALSDPDPDPKRYHPLTYAQDVIQMLDQLAIERAIFIGTSLGGLVTMVVAGLAPQRIAAAVLNDVGPELGRVGLERILAYMDGDWFFANWSEAGRQIAAKNGHLPAHFGDHEWERVARRLCREESGKIRFDYDPAIREQATAADPAAPVDMWPLFRALAAAPLLIIRGECSDLLSASALDSMVASSSGAVAVTVPGVAHAPDLEEPAAVAAMDTFLERAATS